MKLEKSGSIYARLTLAIYKMDKAREEERECNTIEFFKMVYENKDRKILPIQFLEIEGAHRQELENFENMHTDKNMDKGKNLFD